MQALSLMYHDVIGPQCAASGDPSRDTAVYKLGYDDFREHVRAIEQVVGEKTIQKIDAMREWGQYRPIFLTFDDGGVSAHTYVAALLEEYGWRGHFFITTDWIGRPGFLNQEQIRELLRRGHMIGSHSCSHPMRMSLLDQDQLFGEWKTSVEVLSSILGEQVRVASLPGGYYSQAVAETAAAAGIEVLFTSEPTAVAQRVDGCLVLGRYVVQRGMRPAWSAGFASGRLLPRWKQAGAWKLKKAVKAVAGDTYLKVRTLLLAR